MGEDDDAESFTAFVALRASHWQTLFSAASVVGIVTSMLIAVSVALLLAENGVGLPGELLAGGVVGAALVAAVLIYQQRSYARLNQR